MPGALGGRPDYGGRRPGVRGGVVARAAVEAHIPPSGAAIKPAPDDHLAPRPDRAEVAALRRSPAEGDWRPAVGRWVVPAAVDETVGVDPGTSAPDDHLAPRPDGDVLPPGRGRSERRGRRPAVRGWIVAPAGGDSRSGIPDRIEPAPDDHLSACPDGGVKNPSWRSAVGRGRHPGVRGRIVATAGVEPVVPCVPAAPDDHLSARPDRAVIGPPGGSSVRRGLRPGVGRGVVAHAGVQSDSGGTAPDDHFAPGPYRRVSGTRIHSPGCLRPCVRLARGHRGDPDRGELLGRGRHVAAQRRAPARPPGVERRLRPGGRRGRDGVGFLPQDSGHPKRVVPFLKPADRHQRQPPGQRGNRPCERRRLERASRGALRSEHVRQTPEPLLEIRGVEGDLLRPRLSGRLVRTLEPEGRLPVGRAQGLELPGARHSRHRRLGPAPHLAVEPPVTRVVVADQAVRQRLPGQGLGDQKRIVPQRREDLPQHLRRSGAGGDPFHLGLQLPGRDRSPPDLFERVRFPEVVLDTGTDLRRREHRLERRLVPAVLPGPYPVFPVHAFDRLPRLDPIRKSQIAGDGRTMKTNEAGEQGESENEATAHLLHEFLDLSGFRQASGGRHQTVLLRRRKGFFHRGNPQNGTVDVRIGPGAFQGGGVGGGGCRSPAPRRPDAPQSLALREVRSV